MVREVARRESRAALSFSSSSRFITAHFPDTAREWDLLTDTGLTPQRLFFYVLAVEFLLDLFKYSPLKGKSGQK